MKIPLSWLREWVDIDLPTRELASRLTLAGFEVEGCAPAAPPFTGVVVAHVLDARPHPQADKLRLCQVDAGGAAPLQIVCGAPNARAGLKVALAQVGATLPGDLTIQSAALRGVESQGMLCSARELGLLMSSEGIIELPADAPVGTDLRGYLDLDDAILEVSIYPNRGDAMSVQGLAREVSALLRQPARQPGWAAVTVGSLQRHPLSVLAPAAAPRVLTRVVQGIDNTRSTPHWLQERLRRAGLRPISPAVDITNYVMLELGQPLHAYDLAHLQGGLQVRFAQAGEQLELLDGRRITLATDELVIADDSGAIGLAGIMGGLGTAISPQATTVLFESACFTPAAIAGRARRHGLQTDASQRFERGVDPQGQRRAIDRASQLLVQICGGIAGPIVEAATADIDAPRPSLVLRRKQLARLVGTDLPDAAVRAALVSLQMQVEDLDEGWRVTPPSWRFDISIEADLIEEAVRVIGFDQVPEQPARLPQRFRSRPEAQIDERVLLDALTARGYQEAINYAFCDPVLQQRLLPAQTAVCLLNPIAADLGVMRLSLWPGLLKCALDNQRRQQDRVRLCELGTVFTPDEQGVTETRQVAGVVLGTRLPEQWGTAPVAADFHDLKADAEAIFGLSNCLQDFVFEPEALSCLHPGRAARVSRDGQPVGWLGELHPELVHELGFTAAPLLFEFHQQRATQQPLARMAAISRFPQVRRDLSVTLPVATPLSQLRDRVMFLSGPLLRELRIFDVYQGQGIETGRKSVAFGLIFQDNNKTLADDDADRIVALVAADLRSSLDAQLRE